MKKLFITSGAMGDYNALNKELSARGFDINNSNHILIFLGDMLGSTNSIDKKRMSSEMQNIIRLYFRMVRVNRAFWIMGEQEQMFLDFINTPVTKNLKNLRKYVINKNFLTTLSDFIGGVRNTFSPQVMQELQRNTLSWMGEIAYGEEYLGKGSCSYSKAKLGSMVADKLTEDIKPYMETENYFLSYADFGGLILNDCSTIDNGMINIEEKIFTPSPINKHEIIGGLSCAYVLDKYNIIVSKGSDLEFLSHGLQKVEQNSDKYSPIFLRPLTSPFGKMNKYYINSDINSSKRVNVLVVEDNLIPPKEEEVKEEAKQPDIIAETLASAMDGIGITTEQAGINAATYTTTATMRYDGVWDGNAYVTPGR